MLIGLNEIELKEKDELIRELRSRLVAMERTIGWRMLEKFWRLRDRILPPGSRQRNLYRTLRRVLEVLLERTESK